MRWEIHTKWKIQADQEPLDLQIIGQPQPGYILTTGADWRTQYDVSCVTSGMHRTIYSI